MQLTSSELVYGKDDHFNWSQLLLDPVAICTSRPDTSRLGQLELVPFSTGLVHLGRVELEICTINHFGWNQFNQFNWFLSRIENQQSSHEENDIGYSSPQGKISFNKVVQKYRSGGRLGQQWEFHFFLVCVTGPLVMLQKDYFYDISDMTLWHDKRGLALREFKLQLLDSIKSDYICPALRFGRKKKRFTLSLANRNVSNKSTKAVAKRTAPKNSRRFRHFHAAVCSAQSGRDKRSLFFQIRIQPAAQTARTLLVKLENSNIGRGLLRQRYIQRGQREREK